MLRFILDLTFWQGLSITFVLIFLSGLAVTVGIKKCTAHLIGLEYELQNRPMMRKLLFLLPILFFAFVLNGQNVKELFQNDDILELTMAFNEKEVYTDTDERKYHKAIVTWTDSSGEALEIPSRVKIRGKTRANKATCKIPPLFLNFKGSETKGTPFYKQKKIKLVTHCKNSKSYAEYVKKEYMAYRLYNLVSDYGFKVRLCRITYVDSEKPDDSSTHYGFLLESMEDLAKRNDMKEYDGILRNQEALNKDNLDKLTLFQYMIGNLDWSIPNRHNVKIMLADDGSLPIAVPYDFDYSGIVDAPYAVPPESIEIPDVTARVFRGLCRDQGYREQIQFYKTMQPTITEEIKNASYMDEKTRSEVLNYIQEFFLDINDPRVVQKDIDQACRAKHKHRYEYQ